MKEKLQEYALIAEIIGGIAIVASLVFVGFQVNQTAEETALNTLQMQANAYQDLSSQITALNHILIENPEVDVLSKTSLNYDDLSLEDQVRVGAFVIMIVRMSDMAYHQFEQGMISEERLMSAVGPLADNLCNPIYRQIWQNISKNFVQNYQNFVSGLFDNC